MNASTQTDRLAADWLARRDGASWRASDEAELQVWLQANTANRVAFLRVQSAWQQAARLKALDPAQAAARTPARPPAFARWFAAAAALVAVSVLAGSLWWGSGLEHSQHQTVLGRLNTVPLSDGSLATLGSDTQISVRLSRGQRHIALDRGEGYFEVAKDRERPFVVQVGGHRVVAVGTAFSVRRQGSDLRVVVTEGRVRLEPIGADGAPITVLGAGSVATTSGEDVLVRQQSLDDVARLVGWRSGMLAFQDTSLAAAAQEFNRYSTRQLELGDAEAGALRVGGSFRWDNVDTFVALLEEGFPVCAEHLPGRIVLHSSGAPACR